MTANIAHSRFGRGLIAVRDADVAAEATGIRKARLLMTIFVFTGASAAIAGGLFATLQTYITPDAFTFDLSVLFFISILIGGRGSILGPLLGTVILTLLPEFAAPLAAWSTFLHASSKAPIGHPTVLCQNRVAMNYRRVLQVAPTGVKDTKGFV